MSRRKQDEEKKGSPAWMATYGDMVTLLLVFFVMLFAMSTIDIVKFEKIIQSIQGSISINYQGEAITDEELITDGNIMEQQRQEMLDELQEREQQRDIEDMEKIYLQISAYIEQNHLGDAVEITKEKPGILIRFTDNVLYDSGKADLKVEAKNILTNIAAIFEEFDKNIRVEGHTDNVPIHNEEFDSNWELSGQRAANVVKYFIEENNISPKRLSFSGYGEYHPVADNATPEGRQKNRRVDVVILRDYVSGVISTSEGEADDER